MFETYLTARRVVIFAAIAVLLASAIIVTAFYGHITVPCHGGLEEVPVSELPPRSGRNDLIGGDNVFVDYDLASSKENFASTDPRKYSNVRIVWSESCACKAQLKIKWDPEHDVLHHNPPRLLNIYRNQETGLYVVHEQSGGDVFAFRRTSVSGHVLKWSKALETNNLSMLILFGSIGALLGAYLLLNRAASYALTMCDWRPARRREDGVLEDANGAIIARLGRVFFWNPDVLVNPKRVEGRSVYRELPLLSRRDVAPGNHAQWTNGTYRRFRDAKVLAVLATLSTALAVGAQFFAFAI